MLQLSFAFARRTPRRQHLAYLTGTALLALVTGCDEPLSDRECDRLLDHYTEWLLRDERPKVTQQEIAQKQAAARVVARSNPAYEFDACSDKVKRSQYECALEANSVDAIEQCLAL